MENLDEKEKQRKYKKIARESLELQQRIDKDENKNKTLKLFQSMEGRAQALTGDNRPHMFSPPVISQTQQPVLQPMPR